jgi:hypothetical protein
MITVKHLPNFLLSDAHHASNNDEKLIAFATEHFLKKSYTSVARLLLEGSTTKILNDSYHLTNSIDSNWFENPYLTFLLEDGCRSTSIGDIIDLHGELYVVAFSGFLPLEL